MWFAGVYKEPRVHDLVREGLGPFYSPEKVWDCVPGRGLLTKKAGLALLTEVEV